MALVDVKVPDIGDFKDVAVIELMVAVGDTIAVDQSLVTVESDKASMEIPSSHAGVVHRPLLQRLARLRPPVASRCWCPTSATLPRCL